MLVFCFFFRSNSTFWTPDYHFPQGVPPGTPKKSSAGNSFGIFIGITFLEVSPGIHLGVPQRTSLGVLSITGVLPWIPLGIVPGILVHSIISQRFPLIIVVGIPQRIHFRFSTGIFTTATQKFPVGNSTNSHKSFTWNLYSFIGNSSPSNTHSTEVSQKHSCATVTKTYFFPVSICLK